MTAIWLGEYMEAKAKAKPQRTSERRARSHKQHQQHPHFTVRETLTDASSASSSVCAERELCVLGYASKMYSDDLRAGEVNGGRTLICWMGDAALMIDRLLLHFILASFDIALTSFHCLPFHPIPFLHY